MLTTADPGIGAAAAVPGSERGIIPRATVSLRAELLPGMSEAPKRVGPAPPLGRHAVIVVVHEACSLRGDHGGALGLDDALVRVEVELDGVNSDRQSTSAAGGEGERVSWEETLDFTFEMWDCIYQLETSRLQLRCWTWVQQPGV